MNYRVQLASLIPHKGKAVELGVAAGVFSDQLLASHPTMHLVSIDRWSDHHDEAEYQQALALLNRHGARSTVIRKTFADALPLFSDNHFDFIYIDGYAHTGQDGGQTLLDWWPKLKYGGVFAGHDFHPDWPLTMNAVQNFTAQRRIDFRLTEGDSYPSWYFYKPESMDPNFRHTAK